MTALFVFVCGAFYEASCVGFVHFSKRSAWKTAIMSALAGLAQVTGIFEAVHNWRVGPFYLAGLGVGAFIGARTAQRMTPSPTPGARESASSNPQGMTDEESDENNEG